MEASVRVDRDAIIAAESLRLDILEPLPALEGPSPCLAVAVAVAWNQLSSLFLFRQFRMEFGKCDLMLKFDGVDDAIMRGIHSEV
jgi:hypothetical protein